MNEKLTPELKRKLLEKVQNVVNADVLTAEDALLMIEVCERAIEREKTEAFEEYMANSIGETSGE